jgi:hypothetical protein
MEYRSFLTITSSKDNFNITIVFNKYIKTDDEAIKLAVSGALTQFQENSLVKAAKCNYGQVTITGSLSHAKLLWDTLDKLTNGELDEISNIFEFVKTVQSRTFNEFISQLPTQTMKGILFSLIKTKDFQVN